MQLHNYQLFYQRYKSHKDINGTSVWDGKILLDKRLMGQVLITSIENLPIEVIIFKNYLDILYTDIVIVN